MKYKEEEKMSTMTFAYGKVRARTPSPGLMACSPGPTSIKIPASEKSIGERPC